MRKQIDVSIETYDNDGKTIEKNNTYYPILPQSGNVIKHVMTIGKYQYLLDDDGKITADIKSKRFDLTEKQDKEIKEWKEHIKALFGDYGKFEYTFTPTEIGDVLSVFSHTANLTKDFTDIDSW